MCGPSRSRCWRPSAAQGGARCSYSTISIGRGRHRPDALKDFSGRTTEMTDYLAEQIVADLPEELREFLLETAILERFDASLADAVRKRSDSEELLERLQHFDALLIPLDDAREWFRYHHLFADFLCQRLRRSSAHRPILLHRRAARALAAVGPKPCSTGSTVSRVSSMSRHSRLSFPCSRCPCGRFVVGILRAATDSGTIAAKRSNLDAGYRRRQCARLSTACTAGVDQPLPTPHR